MNYVSFKEYKEKMMENVTKKAKSESLTDEQITRHGLEIRNAYERHQQKVGEKNGNI